MSPVAGLLGTTTATGIVISLVRVTGRSEQRHSELRTEKP